MRAIVMLQQRAAALEAEVEAHRQTERALLEQSTTLDAIHRLGQRLTAELDLQRLVQAVTDTATQVTGAEFGAFFYNVTNESGESYTLYALSGVPREAFAHLPMPRNTQVFGPTFRGEEIVRSDDIRTDPRYGKSPPHFGLPAGHPPVASYLAVPVISGGKPIGGLFFGHSRPGVFTERAERLVAGLAGQTAIAMDNATLYQHAQDAIRMRDDFLMAVSHDLRTPLTVVLAQAQAVHRRMLHSGQHDERILSGLESIQRRARTMAAVIDELSDTTRLEAGQELSLDRDELDLVVLVAELVAAHRISAERHTFTVRCDEGPLVGQFDGVRLSRVINNLLSNAVKYSPDGGPVEVRVGRETGTGGNWAIVSVADQGLGIPAGDLARIFDRFHRAGNASVRTTGTGIGLTTSKAIVEGHGGAISVHSVEGVGSTFTMRLPLPTERNA